MWGEKGGFWILGSSQRGRGAKINGTMPGRIVERERNRGEVTRRKLMHGQLSESRRQRKTDPFMSMSECDAMGQTTEFSHTHDGKRTDTMQYATRKIKDVKTERDRNFRDRKVNKQ